MDERLLVVDESLSTKVAHRLRERGRASKSTAELGLRGSKDPSLLRDLFNRYPDAVLITADDSMPLDHEDVIVEVAATIATVEPWERRRRVPLLVPEGLTSGEVWKREVVARWAHAMATQPSASVRRYTRERSGRWSARASRQARG